MPLSGGFVLSVHPYTLLKMKLSKSRLVPSDVPWRLAQVWYGGQAPEIVVKPGQPLKHGPDVVLKEPIAMDWPRFAKISLGPTEKGFFYCSVSGEAWPPRAGQSALLVMLTEE